MSADAEKGKVTLPMETVYLLGDSITQGLGSKKVNFTGELESLLGDAFEVVNLAHTGTTIDYALGLLDQGKIVAGGGGSETRCVILYGNVDAQIRPSREGRVFPHIPKRYQGGGMLMPRPFYSHSAVKRLGQYLDNLQRKFFAGLIRLVDGTEQWASLPSFVRSYSEVLDRLSDIGVQPVLCSCVYIDERLFPGSLQQYVLFNEQIDRLACERGLSYVDLFGMLEREVGRGGWDSVYNKDHFHPNGTGYHMIARAIMDVLRAQELDLS